MTDLELTPPPPGEDRTAGEYLAWAVKHWRTRARRAEAEVERLRALIDAEVLLSHAVVDMAAEAIEQAQVRGRVRMAHRLGEQGRRSVARAVLDIARAALAATAP